MVRRAVVVIAALLVAAGPLHARAGDDPAPGSTAWHERDNANMAYAMQRQIDMLANPAFGSRYWTTAIAVEGENIADRLQHPDRPTVSLSRILPGETADPYRRSWGGARGIQQGIEYLNGCGARIQGTVFGPSTGGALQPPYPGVVITTGAIDGYEEMYWWAAQGLAEAGYVVMTFDVMGQGESQENCPDGSTPTGFDQGTRDALAWFLSPANPLRGWIDDERLGLAGHSAGAGAVGRIGNADPRIDAVVGWDGINLGSSITPSVPTMSQNAEYFFNVVPRSGPPDPAANSAWFDAFEAAGIDAMHVSLRGSTHLEWTFVPYILPASRDGERVAMYYTLAWFDRWLKPDTHGADAMARLTATTFDGSADASSIGAGTYDAATNANVPNLIEGEPVEDHLSIYYRSAYRIGSAACSDMRRLPC